MAEGCGSGERMRGEKVAGREARARCALGLGSCSSHLMVRPCIAEQGVVKGFRIHSGF